MNMRTARKVLSLIVVSVSLAAFVSISSCGQEQEAVYPSRKSRKGFGGLDYFITFAIDISVLGQHQKTNRHLSSKWVSVFYLNPTEGR